MRSQDLVRDYFGREAARFDAIYERDKPLHQRIGDALFRHVIHERYSLVVNAIGAPGSRVLDVGCGPGRYGIELARRGAERCVGVDVAASMIEIARDAALEAGVADHCDWHISDFLSWHDEASYDAVVAMGYFDYLENPRPHLERMIALARGRIFASLPKRWEFRAPLRVVRFKLQKGFVRFYARGEILTLFEDAGARLACLSLVDLGRDYIAIYDAGAANMLTAH
jgi:2-polyprenyl-3-methyl-5-hydroxy-6-metoxy-1,4-benzoquinol methylase